MDKLHYRNVYTRNTLTHSIIRMTSTKICLFVGFYQIWTLYLPSYTESNNDSYTVVNCSGSTHLKMRPSWNGRVIPGM